MNAASHAIELFVITYNRFPFFKVALESLLAQTAGPFNITVLDDAGPAGAQAAQMRAHMDAVCASHPHVRYVCNARNLGQIGNIRKAAELSQAPYTLVFHDDDALHPCYMEMALRALGKYPQLSLIATDYTAMSDISLKGWETVSDRHYYCETPEAFARFLYLLGRVCFPGIIYKTAYLRQIGDLTDAFGGVIFDRPFAMSAVPAGGAAVFTDRRLLRYRMHPGQESHAKIGGETYDQMERHNQFFKEKLSGSVRGRFVFAIRCYKTLKSLYAMRNDGRVSLRDFVKKANRAGAGGVASALCNLPVVGAAFYGLCNAAASLAGRAMTQRKL